MTRFWWVRHGPTHSRVMTPRDAPADLSDLAALARLRAFLPVAPVVASPLRRATMTADALTGPRPRLPDDPDLAEFHHGAWEGLGWEEIAARWPALSRTYWEAPGTAAPPGGESWNDGAARVARAVARLAPHEDVILVAHHGVILTQLSRAQRQPPAAVLAQPIAPLSVTQITWDGAVWGAPVVSHRP